MPKDKETKPKESRYARKKRALRDFIRKGGTWEKWVEGRESGRIRV